MGRIGLLLFSLLASDNQMRDTYDSSYHQDLYMFAEPGFKKSHKSSIIVNAFGENDSHSMGSGNYLKVYGKRFILTALHVVEDMPIVYVTDRSGFSYAAEVKYVDKLRDIAILTVERKIKYAKAIEYNPARDLEIGKEVFYCGHPNGQWFTSYEGRINGFNKQFITLDSFGWPGASGSVIFDKQGNVIGVASAVPISSPTGFPVIISQILRVGPVFNLSRDYVWRVLNDSEEPSR